MPRLLLASLVVIFAGLGLSGCSKCSSWIYGSKTCDVTQPQMR